MDGITSRLGLREFHFQTQDGLSRKHEPFHLVDEHCSDLFNYFPSLNFRWGNDIHLFGKDLNSVFYLGSKLCPSFSLLPIFAMVHT